MFAGIALGLLVGVLAARVAPLVFGGAAAGAITGLAFPELALRGVEMTVHFIAGLFGGARALAYEDIDESDFPEGSRGHRWLKAAFTFGVVFAVVLALLLRL
jgi:hypothetical protein